ncbi:circadian locomoter output cycles protein kaput-like [Teleopsis dalmanni]|uniref:circadian locomoter output cycles protein kaput-like n=1 Tax=Teleopsis dalmanni TaxID=139649 RepID=UPI0018CCF9A3|nr:circadian locomoter output cycles protein kaput-like [Teleopsis dalmanni]
MLSSGNSQQQHHTQHQQQQLQQQQQQHLHHTQQQNSQNQQTQSHTVTLYDGDLNFTTFAELCRLCSIRNGPAKINLFEKEAEQRNLIYKLRTLLPANISKDDFLPKNICEGCVLKVEHLFEFRQSCLHTENILRNYADSMRAVTATINFQVLIK